MGRPDRAGSFQTALRILLFSLLVAPLWIWKIQTQDGPAHLYNAMLLRGLDAPQNTTLRTIFAPAFGVATNWTSDILAALFLGFVPAETAHSVVLTLCVVALPLAVIYLMRAAGAGDSPFVWAGFLFAYNWCLFIGFYNFTLSVAIYLWGVGYWFRHRSALGARRWAAMYAILALAHLTHVFSFTMLVFSLTVGELALGGHIPAFRRAWGSAGGLRTVLPEVRKAVFPCLVFCLKLLPAYALALHFIFSRRVEIWTKRIPEVLCQIFFEMRLLVYYPSSGKVVAMVAGILLAAAAVKTLEARFARGWRAEPRDVFVLLGLIFTALYFTQPSFIQDGHWGVGFLNERFLFYGLLVILPWLDVSGSRRVGRALAAGIVVLTVLHVTASFPEFRRHDGLLDELASGAKALKPHSTFSFYAGDPTMGNRYVVPFNKAPLLLAQIVPDLAWVNPRGPGFPHHFRRILEPKTADYFLAWGDAWDRPGAIGTWVPADLSGRYKLIYGSSNLKIYESLSRSAS